MNKINNREEMKYMCKVMRSKGQVRTGHEDPCEAQLVDYSRAPCLGADQKARGLWERDWPVIETLSTRTGGGDGDGTSA